MEAFHQVETFHSNALPNESDDCLGRYVGFGLADRPLGIRLTESIVPDGKRVVWVGAIAETR
jgi:hypothetical protein